MTAVPVTCDTSADETEASEFRAEDTFDEQPSQVMPPTLTVSVSAISWRWRRHY